MLGDVLGGDQDDGLAARPAHRLGRLAHPQHRTVLAHLAELPAERAAELLQAEGDVRLNGLSIGSAEDLQHRLADQLVDAVAELLGAERIDGHDRAGGIHHEVHGRVVLEHRPPLLFALPQALVAPLEIGCPLTNARLQLRPRALEQTLRLSSRGAHRGHEQPEQCEDDEAGPLGRVDAEGIERRREVVSKRQRGQDPGDERRSQATDPARDQDGNQ